MWCAITTMAVVEHLQAKITQHQKKPSKHGTEGQVKLMAKTIDAIMCVVFIVFAVYGIYVFYRWKLAADLIQRTCDELHEEHEEYNHAFWIKTENGMKCSACGCRSSLWDEYLKSTFCPWCGARMDGDEGGS
jgi:hypothetical protein